MSDNNYVTGLYRMGDKITKHRLITLSGHDEVSIGRSPNVTVSIVSAVISRCHAVLKDSNDGWTIKDNKSLNGVIVNGKRLDPEVPFVLQEGDIVQFGASSQEENIEEFIFQFHKRIKVKRSLPKTDEDEIADSRSGISPSLAKYSMKRIKLDSKVNKPLNKRESNWSPFERYKDRIAEKNVEAENKLKAVEAKLEEMQKMLQEKEHAQIEMKSKLEEERKRCENKTIIMKEKLREKEKELEVQTIEMKAKLKEKEAEMEKELKKKEEDEMRMREELEAQLLQREHDLKDQLQAQKESLIKEKEEIEENLQATMTKALEEKDKKLQKELMQNKQKLEMVIQQKETEQKMLESQLNETKEEKNKQKEAMLHTRQDILANFADLMETELQCSICNELFIQATSLNCSHSFCSHCITQWMKVKKVCPICRANITSNMRSIALDNYIDTMVEHLSDELKERRQNLVAERKGEPLPNRPSSSSGTSRGNPSLSGYRGTTSPSGNQERPSTSSHRGNTSSSGHRGNTSPSGRQERPTSSHRGNTIPSGHRGNTSPSGHQERPSTSSHRGNTSPSGHRGNTSPSGRQKRPSTSSHRGNTSSSGHRGNTSASGHQERPSTSNHRGNTSKKRKIKRTTTGSFSVSYNQQGHYPVIEEGSLGYDSSSSSSD